MADEIKLPELGENLEGGVVLDVRVAVGDAVTAGQTLIEVEAEKSTVEVPAPRAGTIARLLVKNGDTIKVGQMICVLDGAAPPTKAVPEVKPAAPKAVAAVSAPREAKVAPMAAPPPAPAEPEKQADRAPIQTNEPEKAVQAGPATRRLARELGVDLRLVPGTAPGGRISEEDIKAYVRQLTASGGSRGTGPAARPALPDFERWGAVERRPLDGVRRRTAEQMSLAWSQVAHVTQFDQADITELDAFRRKQEAGGPKLTVTAFALKAVAVALKQFPAFNSSLDLAAGQLVLKRYYHIGVAVDTERGLLVPVLRDVDRKSIRELAQELADIAERARQKKVTADEMRGGTFTITNLGGIGGTAFTPIVNYPEVAILGMSRSRLMPMVHEGPIVPRLLLPLSLSYDHRVIDGADAARFTRLLAQMLENPLLMLL